MLFVPPPFIKVTGSGGGGIADPTDIAGCLLWVRADLGVTKDGSNLVSTWADQSGAGRDFTEAGSSRPLWVTSLVNGHAGVRFDGSNDKMKTADFAQAQPYHYFVIGNWVSFTTDDTLVCPDNDASVAKIRCAGSSSPATIDIRQGATSGAEVTGVASGAWHLYRCLMNGTSSTLALDAGTPDTDTDNMSSAIDGFTLGAAGNSSQYGNVEIAEFVVYSAAISGTDLTNLLAYFQTRYGLW